MQLSIIKILTLLALISGCGFQPIYKTNLQDDNIKYENKLAAVSISVKRKRLHQKLKHNLTKVLNPNEISVEKEYVINIDIRKTISSTLIRPTGSSGRNKVTLIADYSLRRISDNEIIANGQTTAKDDFDVEEKRFANYIAQEEIALNLTRLIAQNIRDSLINDLFNEEKQSSESFE